MSDTPSFSAHNGGLCTALAVLKAQALVVANKPVDLGELDRLGNRITQMPAEVDAIMSLSLRSGRPVPDMTEEFVLKQILPGGAYD